MTRANPPESIAGTFARTPEERLSDLLATAKDLPTIPKVAIHLARLVDDPNASAAGVAKVLTSDQILTAKVLRMANSAFYGAPRKISTVTDAIVLLGMRTIRNMAMAVSCVGALDREMSNYAIRRGDVWRHAICAGYTAQLVAERVRYPATEEAFVAGLMHDIGKVVIDVYFAAEFTRVMSVALRTNQPFYVAEKYVLGFDHAEVGARIIESWKLPHQLVEAIRYHHVPSRQPVGSALTEIVHVADILCLTLGIGVGKDGLRYAVQDGVLDKLGLTREKVEEIMVLVADFLTNSELMR